MNIKDLCKIVEILENKKHEEPVSQDCPWHVGKKYMIRTVTMHIAGELTWIGDKELVLKNAAWIADSGRFNEAVRDISKCNEVEPFEKDVIIGRGSIVDATEIDSVILEVK